MLDQFRALGTGDDQRRRQDRPVWLRDSIRTQIVATICQRSINVTQDRGAALVITANHNAVGKQKISDRGAFTQEFGIGGHVERIRIGPIPQNNAADPLTGVNRNRAFLDDDFVVVDSSRDLASHRFHVGEVGLASLGWRCTNGDEDCGTQAGCCFQVIGESQPLTAMPVQQFRQELLVNGHLTIPQRGELGLVIVDQDDLVS